MYDTLLGEMGLLPATVRALAWCEVDSYLCGYERRRQKELAGFRLVAVQVYNALAETPMSAEDWLPLPLIDLPPAPVEEMTVNGETAEQFRARMSAQNAETLAKLAD